MPGYREGRGQGQRVERDALGGPGRDHSVHVEVALSKVSANSGDDDGGNILAYLQISFLYQLFAGDATILSMSLLTVHDIEIRDRMRISNYDKMLYQVRNMVFVIVTRV